jgi:deoxyribonucleoside regulator
MNDTDQRLSNLVEIARLFYEEKRSKTAIANQFKISGTHAARLLTEAEQLGLVEVRVRPPRLQGLQQALLLRYNCLREVIVIAVGGDSKRKLGMLGQVAAEYFDTSVEPGMKVGISGGNTIYEMITALPSRVRDVQLYPTALIGRGPFIPEHVDPMVLITLLWEKSGRTERSAYYVTIPPFDKGSKPAKVRRDNKILKTRPKVAEVWKGMQGVDIVFASVGLVRSGKEEAPRGRASLLDLVADLGVTPQQLMKSGAIGDMSYALFDKDGKTRVEWEYFITLGIDHFRLMAADYPRRRVVVIAGEKKQQALASILRGGLCNVLITDDTTAENLLRYPR